MFPIKLYIGITKSIHFASSIVLLSIFTTYSVDGLSFLNATWFTGNAATLIFTRLQASLKFQRLDFVTSALYMASFPQLYFFLFVLSYFLIHCLWLFLGEGCGGRGAAVNKSTIAGHRNKISFFGIVLFLFSGYFSWK